MTRTVAADAVMPACPRSAAACPSAVGIAIARTGPAPRSYRTRRPGRVRPPFLRHRPGAPQAEPTPARPLHRLPVTGKAGLFAGWPADPGRDPS